MSKNDIDAELLDLLLSDDTGIFDAPVKPRPITTDDRLERAFIEILEFYDTHKRIPSADTMDIAERKLGARLVGIRGNEEKKNRLEHLDDVGILEYSAVGGGAAASTSDESGGDDLLSGGILSDDLDDILGLDDDAAAGLYDVDELPKASPKTPESVAHRKRAHDFDQYETLFKNMHAALVSGEAAVVEFTGESAIREGKFYLLKGMLAFVAEVYEPEANAPLDTSGRPKSRLRVIFENGTESKMYLKSLSVRIYEENGQEVTTATSFSTEEFGDADTESGYLYVLKSLSDHPDVSSLSNLYKIGFTTGSVEKRIAGAEKTATYLYAPVEIVATYRLYNLRPSVLEHLIHTVFARARVDIEAINPAWAGSGSSRAAKSATEWFIAPIEVIDQAIGMGTSGEIANYYYDPATESLRENE